MKGTLLFALGLAAGATLGFTVAVFFTGAVLLGRRNRPPRFAPMPTVTPSEARARYLHPTHHQHGTHRRHHLAPNYVAPVLHLDRYREN